MNHETHGEIHASHGVCATAFRDAMALISAAVHVVTSDGEWGRVGFTASAVCSVTDTPPTLLVCINRSSSSHAMLIKNGVLCVNTLGIQHTDISKRFGGGTLMNERFQDAGWSTLATGAPVLNGALVVFDCRVTDAVAVGTHDVLFCQVVAIGEKNADHSSMIYYGRQYLTTRSEPVV